jgi:hypothetical protein
MGVPSRIQDTLDMYSSLVSPSFAVSNKISECDMIFEFGFQFKCILAHFSQ